MRRFGRGPELDEGIVAMAAREGDENFGEDGTVDRPFVDTLGNEPTLPVAG